MWKPDLGVYIWYHSFHFIFMFLIWVDVKWYVVVTLICISLIPNGCWASFHVIIGCLCWISRFHFFKVLVLLQDLQNLFPDQALNVGPAVEAQSPGSSLSWSPLIFLPSAVPFLPLFGLDKYFILFHFTSSGEGNGNPLQYSCLGNPMDREAWWATVQGGVKSWTWQSACTHTHTHTNTHNLFIYTFLISHLSPHTWNFSLDNVTYSQTCDVLYPYILLLSLSYHLLFFFLSIYLAVPDLSGGAWDLVSWPGIEPMPLALEHRVLATGPWGKSLIYFYIHFKTITQSY